MIPSRARSTAIVLFICGACFFCGTPLIAGTLQQRIMPLIAKHQGDVAVAIKHLESGESFFHQAEKPMPTASLIKLPVMVEAFRQYRAKKIDFDQTCVVTKDSKVPGSGVLTNNFSDGTKIKLSDAVRLMIVFSDNTATNLVLDAIGVDSTSKTMQQLGFENTKIHSKVFRSDTSVFPIRSQQFGLGSTTAAEMVELLKQIKNGKVVDALACEKMLEHLRACDDRTKICRLLPREIKVAHKTGAVSRSRTDAGLIESPSGTIAICILTNGNHDKSRDDNNQANVLCGKIAKAAYDYFSRDSNSQQPIRLSVGATGDLVEALQRTLNNRVTPSPKLSVDGDFGPATEAAVKLFQRQKGLEQSGIVDQKMWDALGTLILKDAPVADPKTINSEKLTKRPADSESGAPFVTCKGWVIVDAETGDVVAGDAQNTKLHPASITKIMTAYVVLELAEKDPSVLTEKITFSKNADDTIGSTAGVKAGEIATAQELLYGLLLPSGNDASVAFAEHFGERFRAKAAGDEHRKPYDLFVREMNRTAKRLGMKQTQFQNTSGLTSKSHLTTALDIAVLSRKAMSKPLFQTIVATRQRGYTLHSVSGYTRNVLWKNTNRLLAYEGYHGIKTGTTSAAGACLASLGERNGKRLIVVVLGSSSSASRYTDTRNLFRYGWKVRDLARVDQ